MIGRRMLIVAALFAWASSSTIAGGSSVGANTYTADPGAAPGSPLEAGPAEEPPGPGPETVRLHTGGASDAITAPNVLFISIDDLRMFDGAIGHPQAITPNIDRLVAEGMLFTNATSDSTICGPSRTSLLLGLRPSSTGVDSHADEVMDYGNPVSGYFTREDSVAWQNYGEGIGDVSSLFDQYDRAGFFVGYAGKVSHSRTHSDYDDADGVFDYYAPFTLSIVEPHRDRRNPDSDDHPVHGYDDVIAAKNHRTDWGVLSEIPPPPGRNEPFVESDTTNHRVRSDALEMLDQVGDVPFFLSVGFTQPHLPLYIPDRFVDPYRIENLGVPLQVASLVKEDRLDLAEPRTGKSKIQRALFDHDDRTQELYQHYLGAVSQVDEYIGDILARLDERGLADTTNVVLWSDHGYHLGEKQRLGKSLPYYVTTNVPLVVKAPGTTTPGSTTDVFVNSVDLFPTLLDLTGIDHPDDFSRDGRSLVRLLRDPGAFWPFAASATVADSATAAATTVVYSQQGLSYIEFAHRAQSANPLRELYDLEDDPDQLVNLLSPHRGQYDPALEPVVAELRNQLIGQSQPQVAPVAVPAIVDMAGDGEMTLDLAAKDANRDNLLFSVVELPRHGRLAVSVEGEIGSTVNVGELIPHSSMSSIELTYLPDDPTAPVADFFVFAVSDGIAVDQARVDLFPPTSPPSARLYVSSTSGGSVDGIDFADEDILAFDPAEGTWSMVFDGSAVGLGRVDVDAIHIRGVDPLVVDLSVNAPVTIDGLGLIDDSDVVTFIGTGGSATAGRFAMALDGSTTRLTTRGEDVDAISLVGGDYHLSTTGLASAGRLAAAATDLFKPGDRTVVFEASAAGLLAEDLAGVSIDPTTGTVFGAGGGEWSLPGLTGDGDDVFGLATATEANPSGPASLLFDGDLHGFGSEVIDGLHVGS